MKHLDLNIQTEQTIFLKYITNATSNNFAIDIAQKVSSLLAIDYVGRLSSKIDIHKYAAQCASRIKARLCHEVVINDDFSAVLEIFAFALTDGQEDKDSKNKVTEQNASIESAIILSCPDITKEELSMLSTATKDLAKTSDISDVMRLLYNEPKLFLSVVKDAYNKNNGKKTSAALDQIKNSIDGLIAHDAAAKRSALVAKNLLNGLLFVGTLLSVASTGYFVEEILLAASTASLVATGAAYIMPKVAAKVTDVLVGKDGLFSSSFKKFTQLKETIEQSIISSLGQKKIYAPREEISHNLSKEHSKKRDKHVGR